MEGKEGGNRVTKKFKHLKRSFAETAAGSPDFDDDSMNMDEDGDWFGESFFVESDDEGDNVDVEGDLPVVHFPKALREELAAPWKNALILKYLGKQVAFPLFQQRIIRLWNIVGKVELIDVGNGCFVARFEKAKDCKHVFLDGPWKLFDNYIVAQRWQPNFEPKKAKFEKLAVWVRLPGLPVEYFREDALKLILKAIGTPLKLDKTTAGVERGKFARAAVEIDLSKPLVSQVVIRRRVQRVEFEGLHVICFACGKVGHQSVKCPNKPQEITSEAPRTMESGEEMVKGHEPMEEGNKGGEAEGDKYGPWMQVARRPRRNLNSQKKNTLVK